MVRPGNGLLQFVILFAVNAVMGNLLYRNRRVTELYGRFSGHGAVKEASAFGSIGRYVAWNMAIGVALCVVYLLIFSFLLLSAPPVTAGAVFAVLLILVKPLPEAANQYLNTTYPPRLIVVQLVNSIVTIVLSGGTLTLLARWVPVWR